MPGPAQEKAQPIRGVLKTVAQVARRLGVSKSTVVGYYDAGLLQGADMSNPARRSAKRRSPRRALRFREDDIERFEEMRFRRNRIELNSSAREKK